MSQDQDQPWKDLNMIEAQISTSECYQELSLEIDRAESHIANVWPQISQSETIGLQQPPIMTTREHIVQPQSSRQSQTDPVNNAIVSPSLQKAASAPNLRDQYAEHDLISTSQNTPNILSSLTASQISLHLEATGEKEWVAGSKRNQALYNCSIGEYPCLWYKFRRFESLSLFNLYLLQDRIVQFENRVRHSAERPFRMSDDEISKQNELLKEYRKSHSDTDDAINAHNC
jgi:hypothetical protein